MKKIYLIRHGESEGNAGNTWQGPHGSLTQKGRAQAASVASRLKTIPFDALVSSPLARATETTGIIVEHTGWDKGIEYSDLFVERRKPSAQIGMMRTSPESLDIEREIVEHFGESGWHYADEENYEDMTARAKSALAYLIDHPAGEIAVVTHGYFMRVMLSVALAGDSLTPELCAHFLASFRTANSGVTTLIYDKEKEDRPWWLWTWNDHAHLAE